VAESVSFASVVVSVPVTSTVPVADRGQLVIDAVGYCDLEDGDAGALAETAVRERHSRPGASPHAARRVTAGKQPRMLASKCNRDSSIRSPLARALPPRSCQKACHGLLGMKNGKIIGTA
jgi:hypothetical protein